MMEFAASVPTRRKLTGSSGTRLLKRALPCVLPEEILSRPKIGLDAPLARWFREELRKPPSGTLIDPRSIDRGYFNSVEIRDL